jgi:carboxypeptidase C (cathepsin A)
MQRFGKELLRKRSRIVGRFDSRYQGIDEDDAGESADYDASAAAMFGPFTSAINDYLHHDLKVKDENVYEILTSKVHPWSYGRNMSRFPDATNTLRESMSANPYLKLFVASGYYDLATPPATVSYSVEHMRLPPDLQKNIDHHFYEGGHMMYVHEPSMEKLRKDIEAFYEKALKNVKSDK